MEYWDVGVLERTATSIPGKVGRVVSTRRTAHAAAVAPGHLTSLDSGALGQRALPHLPFQEITFEG